MAGQGNNLGKFKRDWKTGDGIPVSWLETVSNFIHNFRVTGNGRFVFNGSIPTLNIRSGCASVKFKITTVTESDEVQCSVSFGTVQGVPDGTYDGVPTIDGGPERVDDETAHKVELAENGVWYLHFKFTFNVSEQLTACDIVFTDPGTSLPTDTAGTTHYHLLGTVEVSGSGTSAASATINQGVDHSLRVQLCGGTLLNLGAA